MILATPTDNPLGKRPLNFAASLDGYAPGLGALGFTTGGAMDFIGNPDDGSLNIPIGGTLRVEGWAAALDRYPGATEPPYGGAGIVRVTIFLDGTPIGDAMLHEMRPDVYAAYPNRPDLLAVGYRFDTVISGYPGDHVVTVIAYDVDGYAQLLSGVSNTIHIFAPPGTAAPVPPAAIAPAPPAPVNVPVRPTVILPVSGSSVVLPQAPGVTVTAPPAASWFSGSTQIAGQSIPNVALVGVAALGLFVVMRSKGRR